MGDISVYNVKEIFEGAWSIDEGYVRSFLIAGSKGALLIDTGCNSGDMAALVKELTNLPVTVAITHSDGDHTGGMELFENTYMHPAEFENFYGKRSGGKAPLPIWEGDVIDLGGKKLETILIPGHTPGSIALYERDRNIMFTGDSVSKEPIWMFGKGRNMEAYVCSMEKLQRMIPVETKFYVSHGPMEQDPSLLPYLIKGARDIRAGKIEGVKPERDLPCLEYDCGEVKFYY